MFYLLMQPDHSRQLLMIPCDTIVSTEGKVMRWVDIQMNFGNQDQKLLHFAQSVMPMQWDRGDSIAVIEVKEVIVFKCYNMALSVISIQIRDIQHIPIVV